MELNQLLFFWNDVIFSINHSVVVRDLWMRKDMENCTSLNVDHHSIVMLKMTWNK
jgi:hypothetical protein